MPEWFLEITEQALISAGSTIFVIYGISNQTKFQTLLDHERFSFCLAAGRGSSRLWIEGLHCGCFVNGVRFNAPIFFRAFHSLFTSILHKCWWGRGNGQSVRSARIHAIWISIRLVPIMSHGSTWGAFYQMSIGLKMSKAFQVINQRFQVRTVWFEVSWHCDDEPLFDATGPSYRVGLAELKLDSKRRTAQTEPRVCLKNPQTLGKSGQIKKDLQCVTRTSWRPCLRKQLCSLAFCWGM